MDLYKCNMLGMPMQTQCVQGRMCDDHKASLGGGVYDLFCALGSLVMLNLWRLCDQTSHCKPIHLCAHPQALLTGHNTAVNQVYHSPTQTALWRSPVLDSLPHILLNRLLAHAWRH